MLTHGVGFALNICASRQCNLLHCERSDPYCSASLCLT